MLRQNYLTLLLSATLAFTCAHAADLQPYDGSRWEKEIAAFEAEDARIERPQVETLFVGSSSIRLWNLEKSFPDRATLNRGFGGSQIIDSVHFAERIVTPYRPPTIVFYAGDNDIASGKSPEQVAADFAAFVAAVREKLPETKVIYIGIKPSLARWKLVGKVRAANKLIQAAAAQDPHQVFVDVDAPMIGEDGLPRKELFRDDGLHLSAAGYELWTKLVTPHLPSP